MATKFQVRFGWLFGTWLALAAALPAADQPGQADLDQAVEIQVTAKTLADLEKVVQHCESALNKGLDKENTDLCKQILSSTLFQRASRLSVAIFEQKPPSPRWPMLRQAALKDLEKAAQHSNLGDIHLLIARLNALPGGDTKRALRAADDAVKAFEDDKTQKAQAILLRAGLQTSEEKRLADFELAIRTDPTFSEAWETRANYFFLKGQFDKAIDDFNKLLESDANNVGVHLAVAEALANLKKYDHAVKHVDKAIELQPDSALSYTLRARIRGLRDDAKGALEDLNQALKLEPQDIAALLTRARLHLTEENLKKAKEDVQQILKLRPGLSQAMLLRSIIAASEENYTDAILDLQAVMRAEPKNPELLLQLARYYQADKRPRKAIKTLDDLLSEDKENWTARRLRGDALLGIGKHSEAIADYTEALKHRADDSGLLNNLAWVLATSPNDKVRDGKRSIELAQKACEVTKYQAPHILSTLAAAYAESGDFETAIKWSTKAVELGRQTDKEQAEQLEKELESYKQKKPWRELQETEDKPDPVKRPDQVFDT